MIFNEYMEELIQETRRQLNNILFVNMTGSLFII